MGVLALIPVQPWMTGQKPAYMSFTLFGEPNSSLDPDSPQPRERSREVRARHCAAQEVRIVTVQMPPKVSNALVNKNPTKGITSDKTKATKVSKSSVDPSTTGSRG